MRFAVFSYKLCKSYFRLCNPIDPGHTKKVDISNLYETLADNFAGVVQYNKDNRRSSQTAKITIETVCDVLVDEKIGKPIDRLAYISNMMLNATKEKCLDYRYSKMIRELRNVTWASEQAEGGNTFTFKLIAYLIFKLFHYYKLCLYNAT